MGKESRKKRHFSQDTSAIQKIVIFLCDNCCVTSLILKSTCVTTLMCGRSPYCCEEIRPLKYTGILFSNEWYGWYTALNIVVVTPFWYTRWCLLAFSENNPWMENLFNDERECVKTQFMWFSVSSTQIVSWLQFCVPVRIFWWTSEMLFCFKFKPLALVLSCLLLKTVTT